MIDVDRLERHVTEGLIAKAKHPDYDLWIYNYTNACVYKHAWNDVTMASRGLILDREGQIVARPFEKFFNVEEHSRSDVIFTEPFQVFSKMDGSLGILYPRPDGEFAIATRGSFTSEQAQFGTNYLRDFPNWKPRDGWTYLFEIIYPQNRIVVDYGDTSDLCYLGAVHNQTGASAFEFGDEHDWPGWKVGRFDSEHLSPKDLTELERPNEEGFVIFFPNSNKRMKAKLAEYVRVHRIISGTNTKRIWEWVSAGDDIDAHLDRVPDEMYEFVKKTVAQLRGAYSTIEECARFDYFRISSRLGPNCKRKDFAEAALKTRYPDLLFRLHDGKPLDESIWRLVKPERAEWSETSQRAIEESGTPEAAAA